MSGGHYNYASHQVQNLASDIEQDIARCAMERSNSYGDTCGPFNADILAIMRHAAEGLKAFGQLAHDIEWYMSGDYGDETLRSCYKEWLAKYGHLLSTKTTTE